jgi:hypothetical protein
MSSPNARVASARRRKRSKGVFPLVAKPSKPMKANFKISDALFVTGCQGIEAKAAALGFKKLPRPITFVGTDQKSNVIGNQGQRSSTVTRYFATIKGFISFCIQTDDLQSAIMVQTAGCYGTPCLPSERSIINNTRFHVMEKTEIMTDYLTGHPVLLGGESVHCRGDWTSRETVGCFKSAISMICNKYRDCTGDYEAECDLCQGIPGATAEFGCTRREHNNGHSRLIPKGNVAKSENVVKAFSSMGTYIDEHYTSRCTLAFLPSELRK